MKNLIVVMCMLMASLLATSGRASAQTPPPVSPSTLVFTSSDADLTLTTSYGIDLFQCTSISSAGACVGQAAAPFGTQLVVAKSTVTTLSPPDSSGANRSINLKVAPESGYLGSAPIGVPFVATLQAIGDPMQGATGSSARSAASNPFFPQGKNPASPTGVLAR